jgi:hypothetical protein
MSVGAFERRARRMRKVVRRYPILQPVANRVGLMAWRANLLRQGRDLHPDPSRLVYIDPREITAFYWPQDILKAAGGERMYRKSIGLIRDGDWDLSAYPLEQLGVFDAVARRLSGAEWDETPFVQEVRASLAGGTPLFKFRRPEDVDRKLGAIDKLAARIADNGYQSQKELGTGRPWDEVLLSIDRAGRIRFVDGRHRLAIARALGMSRIPALVTLRHAQWQRFAMQLRAYCSDRRNRSYQPLLHPDLADITSVQGHDRFNLINAHLPVRHGRLLDIGANKGYFCHRFEALGFECVAVERSVKELFFLEGLRRAAERRFEVFSGSVFDLPDPGRFDVVLALNVFHHFLKARSDYKQLIRFLGRLRARWMVFESHLPGDSQMRDAYIDYAPDAFVSFILENSSLTSATKIGEAADGRPLFVLSVS